MNKVLLSLILLMYSISSLSQSFWKVENDYGDQILLTLAVNSEKKTFVAHTRKDALKDIAGSLTYSVARAAGKLEYPEIVCIVGAVRIKTDSIKLFGDFYYFDKKYKFEAAVTNSHFSGKYIDNRNRSHPLTGIKVQNNNPIEDYPAIITSAIALTEKYLVNPSWLKSDEWISFKKKVSELKSFISDDYEMAALFYWFGRNMPFSPYEISRFDQRSNSAMKAKALTIRELNHNTVVFDANSLPVSASDMDSAAMIIDRKGYSNMIIDLRGRSKITPEAVEIMVNYLSDKSFNAGVYLTRKWFDNYKTIPGPPDYNKVLRSFSDVNYRAGRIHQEAGRYLKIATDGKSFRGKVYVLADSKTSGVSESLIYILRTRKMATIAGQKTSGLSLFNEKLMINPEFYLSLAVSDFYTIEGKSLNKSGIEPDIKVSGEDTLQYILKKCE